MTIPSRALGAGTLGVPAARSWPWVWPRQSSASLARSAAEPASEPAKPVAPPELVDFDTQIEPIFRRQCLKCHGDERSGGLRLDSRQSAAAGGDSGKPILGGTLDTNELYQRVSSDDRTYRMPKNSDPLDEGEIETIKRWVGQGTPWPRSEPPTTINSWLNAMDRFIRLHDREIRLLRGYAPFFLAAQLVLFAISRARTASRRGRPWALGAGRRFAASPAASTRASSCWCGCCWPAWPAC